MKSRAWVLLASIFLSLSWPAHGDTNLLQNGDFKNGMANWSGEFRPLLGTDRNLTGDIDLSKGMPGIIVDLAGDPDKPRNWYGLSQAFNSPGQWLDYSVTYQLSDDYNVKDFLPPVYPSTEPIALCNSMAYMGDIIGKYLGKYDPSHTPEVHVPPMRGSSFTIAIFDKAAFKVIGAVVKPIGGTVDIQTEKGTFEISGDGPKIFFLVLKTGSGRALLYNITLIPSSSPDQGSHLTPNAPLPDMHL